MDKKSLNKSLNDHEYSIGKIVLESVPYNYAIGLTNICQLRCPLCVTGLRKQKKSLKFMDFELFKEIIEKIKNYSLLVQLYRWGEPLLHPKLIDILDYCNKYDLNTEISSNFSLVDIDDKLEAMVKYRLKRLVIAFDGVSQEQYELYRVGGSLSLVKENIKRINRYKYEYNVEYPRIILQFLRNKYTGNQIEVIEKYHKSWGADEYIVYPMLSLFKDKSIINEWFSKSDVRQRKYMDFDTPLLGKVCSALYNFMIIEQDGTIPPCCPSTNPENDFSKWDRNKELVDMFNSYKHILARRQFKDCCPVSNILCKDCSIYLSYLETKRG